MIDILIEKQNLVLISLDWHPHIAASLLAKTTYRGDDNKTRYGRVDDKIWSQTNF